MQVPIERPMARQPATGKHGSVRLLRPLALAALVIGGLGLVASPAGAAVGVVVTDESLAVTPDHGPVGAGLTIAFSFVDGGTGQGAAACPKTQITFRWDGVIKLGGGVPAPAGHRCVVVIRAEPPAVDRAPGPHEVTNDAVASIGVTPMHARYTIDPSGSPDPSASPSAGRRSPSASAAATRPDRTGTPTDTASDPDVAPGFGTEASDSTSPVPLPASAELAGHGSASWPLFFGGGLIVAGAGALGALLWRMRRRPGDEEIEPGIERGIEPEPAD